jgi:potassium-transporting ATPase potassium-binding subunit
MLGFSAVSMLVTYAIERLQAAALEPAGTGRSRPRSGLEHRRQLYHQHQLAVLYARDHHELSHPDGRPGDAQLLVGGRRHRGGRGPDPRHQAHHSGTIGNFWVDTTRTCSTSCFRLARLRAAAGRPGRAAEPARLHHGPSLEQPTQTQTIAQGPGGLAGSHQDAGHQRRRILQRQQRPPFENPTPFSNFLQILSIFIIPAGLTYTLGRMTGSPGHGWAVLAAMFVLFAAGFTAVYWAESQPHPLIHGAAADPHRTAPGGNMEGKEVRNGIAESRSSPPSPPTPVAARSTACTTASRRSAAWSRSPTSCSARWSSAASARALRHPHLRRALGLHRRPHGGPHPEYLGKKIESYDVKMSMLYVLIFPLIILTLTAVFVLSPTIGLSRLTNQGRTGSPRFSTPSPPAPATTARPLPASTPTTTWWYNVALGWDMLSAASS